MSKMTAIESQLLGDQLSTQKKKRKRKRDLSRMASSLVVRKPIQEFEMPTTVEGMSVQYSPHSVNYKIQKKDSCTL